MVGRKGSGSSTRGILLWIKRHWKAITKPKMTLRAARTEWMGKSLQKVADVFLWSRWHMLHLFVFLSVSVGKFDKFVGRYDQLLSEFGREFDKSDQIDYRNLSHDFAQNQENLAGLPPTIGKTHSIGKRGRLLIFCKKLQRISGNLRKWLIGIF